MPTWAWILIVAVIVLIAIAAIVLMQQRQRAGLRDRFGPEYERAVAESDDRRQAERELADRADRRDKLDIRPLTAEQRGDYAYRWESIQATFVDRPREAVVRADDLIVEVMDLRGYPVDTFDDRASLVSADHPEVVSHYRSAHEVSTRGNAASTEDLRLAFVHYRALFDAMLVDSDPNIEAMRDDEVRRGDARLDDDPLRRDRMADEPLDERRSLGDPDEQGRRL